MITQFFKGAIGRRNSPCDVYGDARDGDVTISVDTIVNKYTDLIADAAAAAVSLEVSTTADFAAGDLILIHQTQNYRNYFADGVDVTAGRFRYEFAVIDEIVDGTHLTLASPIALAFLSDAGAAPVNNATKAQIIKVPQYDTLTVNANKQITAKAWDGLSGGIAVLKAKALVGAGTATISATSSGFRNIRGAGTNTSGEGHFGWNDTSAPPIQEAVGWCNGGSSGGAGGCFTVGGSYGGGGGHGGIVYTVNGSSIAASDLGNIVPFGGGGATTYGSGVQPGQAGGALLLYVENFNEWIGMLNAEGVIANSGGTDFGSPGGCVILYTPWGVNPGSPSVAGYAGTAAGGTGGSYCEDLCPVAPPAPPPAPAVVPTYGDAHDGDVTISADTIVNKYTDLTHDLLAGTYDVYVSDTTDFAAGDLVMFHQTMNYRNYVAAEDDLEANRFAFEFAYVDEIIGARHLTLVDPIFRTFRSNTLAAGNYWTKAQLVKVPQYDTLTVNGGKRVYAKAWDGRCGGLTVIKAKDLISGVNGYIDATAAGFRSVRGATNNVSGEGQFGWYDLAAAPLVPSVGWVRVYEWICAGAGGCFTAGTMYGTATYAYGGLAYTVSGSTIVAADLLDMLPFGTGGAAVYPGGARVVMAGAGGAVLVYTEALSDWTGGHLDAEGPVANPGGTDFGTPGGCVVCISDAVAYTGSNSEAGYAGTAAGGTGGFLFSAPP
jgi:hypothetical protein